MNLWQYSQGGFLHNPGPPSPEGSKPLRGQQSLSSKEKISGNDVNHSVAGISSLLQDEFQGHSRAWHTPTAPLVTPTHTPAGWRHQNTQSRRIPGKKSHQVQSRTRHAGFSVTKLGFKDEWTTQSKEIKPKRKVSEEPLPFLRWTNLFELPGVC